MPKLPLNLAIVRQRWEAANVGPCRVGQPGGPAGPFYSVIAQTGRVVAMQFPRREDAEFDANARSDVPLLLAEVERLTGIVGDLLQALPDSIHPDDPSWDWAWDELSGDAQESVKQARRLASST